MTNPPTTLKEAFEQYIALTAEQVQGERLELAERAFYCGAMRALEIISANSSSLDAVGHTSFRLSSETLTWIRAKGFLNLTSVH